MIRRLKENTDSDKGKVFNKVKNLCARYGYVLDEDSCVEVIRGNKYLSISIYPDGSNKYAPNIYSPTFHSDRKLDGNFKFRISTISVGSLDVNQYVDYLEACNNAHRLAMALTYTDFEGFPEEVIE